MPPKRKSNQTNKETDTTPSSDEAQQPAPPPTKTRRTRTQTATNPKPEPTKPTPGKKSRLASKTGGTTSAAALAGQAFDDDADALAGLSPTNNPRNNNIVDGGMVLDSYDRAGRFSVSDNLMEAVVKVFATHSEPNFSLPWQRRRQYASSGSGFVISNKRILTNAHCVDYQTQVRVKRRGSDTKYVATVLAIGAECDIAMLTVEDEEFWQGIEPVCFGELPRLQSQVSVVGYPVGGDTMSVTSGVVSRIEVTGYVHGISELLGIQVDAAINSGNSGGPAFNDRGECIGIAFQSLKNEDIENISYVIPTPVIEHFIKDYETHGKYTGFPTIGIEWQKTESPALRKALGLKAGQRGVYVRRIEPTSPASKVLSKGDVILSFNGIAIGSDGTVPFRSGERIGFSYLVSQLMSGDEATLEIFHDKKVKKATVSLRPSTRLIPVHLNQQPPSYFIVGGLVFTAASVPLLRSEYGKDYDFDSPVKLLDTLLHGMAKNDSEQIVVLSQVLAHDLNVGYEDIINTRVLQVNGAKVNNLVDLVKAVEESKGNEFLRFDLEYNQIVILNSGDAQKATAEILEQHCIAKDRSADLLKAMAEGGGGNGGASGSKKQGNGVVVADDGEEEESE